MTHTPSHLLSALESLLFATDDSMSESSLAAALGVSEEIVKKTLSDLETRYASAESGLSMVSYQGRWQMTTKPSNAAYLEASVKNTLQGALSGAALEVLAIVAYRGPVTRLDIETIRGVNCSATIRHLLLRELIEREESATDAREYVYSISFRFLREFGFRSVEDFPEYAALQSIDSEAVDGERSGEEFENRNSRENTL